MNMCFHHIFTISCFVSFWDSQCPVYINVLCRRINIRNGLISAEICPVKLALSCRTTCLQLFGFYRSDLSSASVHTSLCATERKLSNVNLIRSCLDVFGWFHHVSTPQWKSSMTAICPRLSVGSGGGGRDLLYIHRRTQSNLAAEGGSRRKPQGAIHHYHVSLYKSLCHTSTRAHAVWRNMTIKPA